MSLRYADVSEAPCLHRRIQPWSTPDQANRLWACVDCSLRFYPACRTCVDVGHRNIDHPVLEIGRCGCTIHEDRGQPCKFTAPMADYRDPLALVCDTCLRVCWGVSA